MDLRSGYPYFLIKNGLHHDFEPLETDHRTDVVVLGGGVSGALVAYELVNRGIECAVVDKRSVGHGSTGASTSLLQYEIDVPLYKLQKKIGYQQATDAYKLCYHAIDMLKEISDDIGFKEFKYCDSVYFAHTRLMKDHVLKEYESRKAAGFRVDYLEKSEVNEQFGFSSGAAVLSHHAAKTDAYLFTHTLHDRNQKRGARIFENTQVKQIKHTKGGVELITDKGHRIKAKKMVYATGYEITGQITKPIVNLRSTYAIITKRIPGLPEFFKHTLFWNTADPYLYISEDNNRLLIGGRDEPHNDPKKRRSLLSDKAAALTRDIGKMFPDLGIEADFYWAGTFGATVDGLPYIGTYKQPHSYFALGFGGNGITFSALAAGFIADHIKDKNKKIPTMFGFER